LIGSAISKFVKRLNANFPNSLDGQPFHPSRYIYILLNIPGGGECDLEYSRLHSEGSGAPSNFTVMKFVF
jgi:hypothetical protein